MTELYISIKQLLVAALLIASFSFFAIKVRRLIALMQSVKGEAPQFLPATSEANTEIAPPMERLKILFSDVLGQTNVRRKLGIGLAHTAIFFGFLLIQPHSLEMMIRGIFPAFSLHSLLPTGYTIFLALADWLAFASLIGFGYVAFRRVVLKPAYLPKSQDAWVIIAFTTIIIVTFFILNALATVSTYAANGHVLSGVPISSAVASLMGMKGWSPATLQVTFELTYWVHLLTIMAFLLFIPSSKHLHLLAAVPNVVLKPAKLEKSIAKTDIEDEDAETFGLGFINELNWKQVMDLYACTECGRCEEQCPAAKTGKALSPREFIHSVKSELFDNADALLEGKQEFEPLVREGGHVLAEQIWDCTTCRACEEACPVNIQHLDIMFEARKYQVLMEAAFPAELNDTFTNIENQSNPWGFPTASRGDWAKELGIPHVSDAPDAEIIYFAGSALSLDDRGKKVSQALMKVLKAAGVKVAILGVDEQDSGDDARRCGNEYLAQMTMQSNVEVLNEYGVKNILTACPHTYNILKNEYPEFGGLYNVVHHSEYLQELLNTGRLTVPAGDLGSITYHDSCYLGRWNGIFEAPRNLLQQINNNTPIVEMAASHEKGMCCGGGGGRMFMEEDTGERINVVRTKQAVETGAQTVAVGCPYCLTMFSDGLGELETTAIAKDIAEILAEKLEA